jgi:streptomycin 6-kinase
MNNFETNIVNLYGDLGRAWLVDLPAISLKSAEEHGLSDLKPLSDLTYHYVLSGFQGELPIIVKLGMNQEDLHREAGALRAFAGVGGVGVLAESQGLLLLERAVPGCSLKSYFPSQDEEAMKIAYGVMKRLHQAPVPKEGFPHLKEWLAVLDGTWNIPSLYLEKARALRDKLLATPKEHVLLHGDLHHDNILQNREDWIVIDPKGVIGDPVYEVTSFIRNPLPELFASEEAARFIAKRITYFSKVMDLDPWHIHHWCYVQAVLAWVWAIEDGRDTLHFARLTKIFDGLMVVWN